MITELKVCFVGIGSIAKRHIENLKCICREKSIELVIDALRHRVSSDTENVFAHIYYNVEHLPNDYDVIFLTNPTEYHADMLKKLHGNAKHYFIEKPITSIATIGEFDDFVMRNESVYYVACPLRYHPVIQYIKENVDVKKIHGIRAISSSYLPDWRPGQDYRDTYSAHKDLGGGVDIDLIHEWDYLTYLFGMPSRVNSIISKKSNLEIDSPDVAIYIAEYTDKTLELHLDYYGRETLRRVELYMEDDTVICDLISGEIIYLISGKIVQLDNQRNNYQMLELAHFLDLIEKSVCGGNDILNAIKVLKLTQGEI